MIKGAQKRMIVVKTGDSAVFEEAYFVMRSDEMAEGKTDKDMISEADRIISENFENKRFRIGKGFITATLSFLCGSLLTFITVLCF